MALALVAAQCVFATETIEVGSTTYELDTVYHAKIGPGTTQTQLQLNGTSSNLQVFYLTIDTRAEGVSMRAVCAKDKVAGNETCTAMATRKSGDGVLYFAGANGDFYSTSGTATNGTSEVGTPTASCTVDREIYKTSNSNYQFVVDTAGVARIGRLDYYTGTATLGESVTLFKGVNVTSPDNGITVYTPRYWGSTNQTARAGSCYEVTAKMVDGDVFYAGGAFRLEVTSEPTNDGDTTIPDDGFVIHGRGTSTSGCNTSGLDFVGALHTGDIVAFDNVVLLDEERIYPAQIVSGNPKTVGQGVTLDSESERTDASSAQPRTAIGVSESGDSIIIMVIDGRSNVSAGIRTSYMADIMRYAKSYEAVNLDGGGSSTLYTSALGVRNRTSDGNERAVGNAIFATLTAPDDDEIAEIGFVDWAIVSPKYGLYTPVMYAYNKYGVVLSTDFQDFTLSCPEELGEIINDGKTLFASGSGTYALTAEYNGITASIPYTVDATNSPELKYTDVLLDNYRSWPIDVQALVGTNYMQVSPQVVTWVNSDSSVATVSDEGVVDGLKDGTTEISGTLGDFEGTVNLTVECPTASVMPIDLNGEMTVKGTSCKDCSLTPLDNGYGVDFTISSARGPQVTLSLAKGIWSLPDAVQIRINPGDVTVSRVTLDISANNANAKTYTYFTDIESNMENVLTLPIEDLADVDDIGIYPILFTSVAFEPSGSTSTPYHVDIPGIEAIYYNGPTGGINNVLADGEDDSFDFNDPNAIYSVYSVSGQLVKKSKGGVVTDNLPAGIYLVTSLSAGKTDATKIAVN